VRPVRPGKLLARQAPNDSCRWRKEYTGCDRRDDRCTGGLQAPNGHDGVEGAKDDTGGLGAT
jgi:hypothetical protein